MTKKGNFKCPVFLTLSLLANKWAIGIIHNLLQAENHTMRFGELQKTLHNITQAELTKQLREFEKSGIIERHMFPQIPPKVEYKLTKLGLSLTTPIDSLSKWAEENAHLVQENINKFNSDNNIK
ncbi:winged helix-turn-helix transcriptional regulator [Candidatus Deianiraea vastatrix]|uniref:HTH-type transcriptional regulator n=1 Tax=Candidatus Deianiraea vastatrix TaxID=2163644 RepID=A0A5B8XIK3_9RICK|nr:helix-turn-helix domain-containing protein [Candidatus Deianiraea vastatrix]QED23811.1 Putative HTH-type transcriptional regulator [Candidatus Deianiraea vastatrix]